MAKHFKIFNIGDKVILDKDKGNTDQVTVIEQTPNAVFTTVIDKNGYEWSIMTYRLTKVDKK